MEIASAVPLPHHDTAFLNAHNQFFGMIFIMKRFLSQKYFVLHMNAFDKDGIQPVRLYTKIYILTADETIDL